MLDRRRFLSSVAGSSLGLAWGGNFGANASLAAILQQDTPQDLDRQPPAATSTNAMIVATTAPAAIGESLQLLKSGGSAADAVLSTALAQIALCAGCWVSYAGRMTAVYFDASTGQVSALNACYDAPRGETDPLSIPRSGTPSGRTTLVPGFMAGVEALHKRFGKLEFRRLFEQAIALADEGFTLSPNMARLIQGKAQVLTRFAGGRSVFQKDDGSLYAAGDHFRQSELAATLQGVVSDGADYCYTGPWAKNFVSAVQAAGGKLSLEDLAAYKPTWYAPMTTRLSGATVQSLPAPNRGGPLTCFALNLADAAGLEHQPSYAESADVLAAALRIEQALRIAASAEGRAALAAEIKRGQFSLDDLGDDKLGQQVWRFMESGNWDAWWRGMNGLPSPAASEHSDAVVAVDEFGNVAAILHTINTAGWGTTGLFVDGVSIPDSAAGQQQAVANAGPGGRIADHGPPLVATRDGLPVVASSATGSGNINASWQCVLGCLVNGMSPQAAADQPRFYQAEFQEADLDSKLLAAVANQGLEVSTVDQFGGFQMGFWAGVDLQHQPKRIRGGKIRTLDGRALGY